MSEQPAFLAFGQITTALDLDRGVAHWLLSQGTIPHLRLATGLRLLPDGYVQNLAKYLKEEKEKGSQVPLVQLIESFNELTGRQLLETARSTLESAVNSQREHTPDEVADILGVNRATVGRWISAGKLPARTNPRPGVKRHKGTPQLFQHSVSNVVLGNFYEWMHLEN